MSDNINMYKTSISQLTEDDADSYSICYNCKKLTHIMHRSLQGYINCCRIEGLGMSTSTVVCECKECYDTRSQGVSREFARRRIIFMQKYLEEKGNPTCIDIDKASLDKNDGLDYSQKKLEYTRNMDRLLEEQNQSDEWRLKNCKPYKRK